MGAAAWDWGHPSLPLPTPPLPFSGYSYKEVSSAKALVPIFTKYQDTAFYDLHNSKLGEGESCHRRTEKAEEAHYETDAQAASYTLPKPHTQQALGVQVVSHTHTT